MIEVKATSDDEGISLRCTDCYETFKRKYYIRGLAQTEDLREWMDLHEGKVKGGTVGLCFHWTENVLRLKAESDREEEAIALREEARLKQRGQIAS